jgi:hypothetical protein
MARAKKPRTERMTSMTDPVPPGATRRAVDRPLDPGGGAPGSGAGPRHAAGDPGTDIESYGPDYDEAETVEEADPLEQGPPYAGISGGAVGGSPAESRSKGGKVAGGLAPGGDRPIDSTIGSKPRRKGK